MDAAIHEFYDFWFGGNVEEIQPFWFEATKNRKLFRRIHEKYGEHLESVASFAQTSALEDIALAVRVVVFLDQQGRNSRAITGKSCEHYDEIALPIAQRLAAIPRLLERVGPAPFCFVTLCLRHSRTRENIELAQSLLVKTDHPVVLPFRRENGAALNRLRSLAFVDEALNRDRPSLCSGASTLCLDVLEYGTLCDIDMDASHPLCEELRSALDLDAPDVPLLSYSGGVDSTCLLLLLRAAGINFSCLFLQHDNRDVSDREAQSVKAICHHLGVPLYMYHIRLTRPHDGEERTLGITREEYERWTKEIRFAMYRHLAKRVILGHHTDDIDENRLEQLSCGHLLGDLDGMSVERQVGDITLLRPLLHCRKADFRAVLKQFPVPYLKDSTPSWSLRGATRRLLDQKPELQPLVAQASRKARDVGAMLDLRLASWAAAGLELNEPLKDLPRRAVMNLDLLAQHVQDVDYDGLTAVVAGIRELYNPVESPLKNIPDPMAKPKGLVAFEKAMAIATQSFTSPASTGHYHTSNKPLINRKAIAHLWGNIMSAKSHFGGGLTQEVGYFCLRPKLLVYDTTTTKKSCQDLRSHFRQLMESSR